MTSDPTATTPDEPTADDNVESVAVEEPATELPDADSASSTVDADATDAVATDDDAAPADAADAPATSVDADADAPAAATPVPAPRPAPTPGRFPVPTPPARRPATPRPSAAAPAEPWGRVDDEGTVSVREGDDWRVVGQYPDGSPAEALAYFERKYADLAGEVTLLEVRQRGGGASVADLRATLATVRERVTGAAAVGDLTALTARLDALEGTLSEASAEEAEAAREAREQAVAARTALVEKIEALAARDPKSIQWKQTTADVNDLFAQWQAQQSTGARLPKALGQQLWKRFRDARATLDKHRREFYSGLDEQHKSARDAKTRLVERAEALSAKGEDGIGDYRALLDQWKTAGRAGKKVDDALWARFKAAGDALYGARADREHADAEASKEKIEAKKALLVEAGRVGSEKDTAKARSLLTGIQRRWDEIGRIFPREAERALDDDLRKIEQSVKGREDADWKRNNPETKARQNDMTSQLHDAIAKLEAELDAAKATGDKSKIAKAQDALEARKGWLRALGG
ncbi:uncharacterized protein DUF349 [Microbacterium telephonicum]|uniref:Uncharacterized protein DUF349 n=1 Tax=Microbacterium telephonicum TaxID=1714841 RepID=A0A498C1M2_9MICO|nr:uncharacterized protein DUF349 [Microbacterium telephonicum]